MKKIAHTLVGLLLPTVLTVLAACHRHGPYPAGLLRADSLCEVAPDSARSVLHAMQDDMDDAPLSTRMYHRLLCIKAADKADVPITSDSAIRPVLRYYEHDGGDPALLPEALYYGGRTYRELGDAPQALDYFDRAINALPDGVDDGLKSNIYSQRGQLFIFQEMYPEAREMFQKALQCALRVEDSLKIAYAYSDIGFCYRAEKQMDSALIYQDKAYPIAHKLGGEILLAAQITRAGLFLRTQRYDSVWAAIGPYFPFERVKAKEHRSALYSIALDYYRETGKRDSALYCAKALLTTGTVYAKEKAYRYLVQSASLNGQEQEYWRGYIQSSDSVDKLTREEAVRKVDGLYNYQAYVQEYQKLKVDVKWYKWLLLASCFLLISIMSLVVIKKRCVNRSQVIVQNAENMRLQKDQEAFQVQEICSDSSSEAKIVQGNKNTVDDFFYPQLSGDNQVDIQEQKVKEVKTQQLLDEFRNSVLYKETVCSVEMQKKLPNEKLQDLQKALVGVYSENLVALLSKTYSIHGERLFLCLLLKEGFSVREIAILKGSTANAVRIAFYRISKDVFGEKTGSVPKLRDFILSL